jgi:hypothetical protein
MGGFVNIEEKLLLLIIFCAASSHIFLFIKLPDEGPNFVS